MAVDYAVDSAVAFAVCVAGVPLMMMMKSEKFSAVFELVGAKGLANNLRRFVVHISKDRDLYASQLDRYEPRLLIP